MPPGANPPRKVRHCHSHWCVRRGARVQHGHSRETTEMAGWSPRKLSLRSEVPARVLRPLRTAARRGRDAGGAGSHGRHRALLSPESTCTHHRWMARPSCRGGSVAGSRAARKSAFRIACRGFPGSCGWPRTLHRRGSAVRVAGPRADACAYCACLCPRPEVFRRLAVLRPRRLGLRLPRFRPTSPLLQLLGWRRPVFLD